jgi:hypothetical protein
MFARYRPQTPGRSVVIMMMEDLIRLNRRNGYRRDDLVALSEGVRGSDKR